MKTLVLFLVAIFIFAINSANAQNNYGTAQWVKKPSVQYFPQVGGVAPSGPDYGCAMTKGRPMWLLISTCGKASNNFAIQINSENYSNNLNNIDTVSFVLWGPFNDTTNAFSQLSNSNIVYCSNGVGASPYFNSSATLTSDKIYYALFTSSDSIDWIGFVLASFATNEYADSTHCSICHGRGSYVGQQACIVTVDSATNRNQIFWTAEDSSMASYVIYRQTSNLNQYDSIGTVSSAAGANFIDQSGDPEQKSFAYKIGTIDSCGRSYDISTSVQTTIHLTSSVGLNGEVNLVWNPYGGYPAPSYSTFYIFRSLNGDAYEAIDSIASNTSTYTDLNPPAGTLHYKIGIRMPPCFQGDEEYAVSNRSSTNIVGISNAQLPDDVVLFPDPVHGSTTLQLGSLNGKVNSLHLLSVNGESVASIIVSESSQIKINSEDLAEGIYILEMVTDDMIYRMPIAVQ